MISKIDRLSSAILLGGKSSRMGVDKAFLGLKSNEGDRSFLDKLASEMFFFEEKYLSLNASQDYLIEGYKNIIDEIENIGPLGGIYSVLRSSKKEYVFFAPCDMPKLTKEAVMFLVDRWQGEDMCIAYVNDRKQPLFGIYGKKCMPYIEEIIGKNSFKPVLLMDYVSSRVVDMSEYEECFVNINTIDDYKKFCLRVL